MKQCFLCLLIYLGATDFYIYFRKINTRPCFPSRFQNNLSKKNVGGYPTITLAENLKSTENIAQNVANN